MGFFVLTRSPSRAIGLPRALLPELQRNKDVVRYAVLGKEVPRYRQKQLMQTIIERVLKKHFSTVILDFEKSTE